MGKKSMQMIENAESFIVMIKALPLIKEAAKSIESVCNDLSMRRTESRELKESIASTKEHLIKDA